MGFAEEGVSEFFKADILLAREELQLPIWRVSLSGIPSL
jgi:hypothetical protein